MRVRPGLAIGIVVALAGCHGKALPKQNRDAAPVVMVDPVKSGSGTRSGSATDEKEPNQTADQATPLALGATARGSLDGSTDVDVYRLAVPGSGGLRLAVSAIDGVDLALEIADPSGVVIARSDRGPVATGEGVPNLGVVHGDYLVTVREFVKPAKKPDRKRAPLDAVPAGRTGPSPIYEITTELVKPTDTTEREPDDDAGAANDMFPGDSVTGYVGWTGDVDVWKLSLESLNNKNAFDVEVTGVDGVAVTVEIDDATGKPIQTRKGTRAAMVALRAVAPRQPEGSAPFHYIKITGDKSNPDVAYTLTVRGRLLDPSEEIEPNDKPDTAQPFAGDSGTMNATYAAGDVDCFAVPPAADAQQLTLSVLAPDGVDAIVEVVVPAGSLVKADAAGPGGTEKVDVTIPAGVRGVAIVTFKPVKADPGTPHDYTVDYRIDRVADELPPEE